MIAINLRGTLVATQSALKHIKAAARIIMMTSSLLHGNSRRIRDRGIISYLTRPAGYSELHDVILKSLGQTQPVMPSLTIDKHNPFRLNILLAEDNRVNQLVARRLLEKEGHQVTIANNRNEVLAIHANQRSKFDLILMDIQMPERDGLDAAVILREREELSGEHIPIIALTAHAMKQDGERCLAAGMDGYVAKPIRLEELRREIEQRCAAVCVQSPSF